MDLPVVRTDPHSPQFVRKFAEVDIDASQHVLSRDSVENALSLAVPRPVLACLSAITGQYQEIGASTPGEASRHVRERVVEVD